MGKPIAIRPATSDDLAAHANLLAWVFHPQDGWQSLLWPLHRLGIREDLQSRLRQSHARYCCLGAWVDQELVGSVEMGLRSVGGNTWGHSWSPNQARAPYVANLAVVPAWRRQGIARGLLSRAEVMVADWGSPDLYLHVLETNQPARRLYESLGYQVHQVHQDWWTWLGGARQLLLRKHLDTTR